jgi:class 3 adenylate cyclase
VLLALLGSGDGIDGTEVARRLHDAGRPAPASDILTALLQLEATGHVRIRRGDRYWFDLTSSGQEAAYTLGPGAPEDAALIMVDVVGYVAYTSRHGDVAAHALAQRLLTAAEHELTAVGGRLVKSLGDGFLGAVPPAADAVVVVRRIASRFEQRHGDATWPRLRAAVHRGRPIRHAGDLYGTDVNLVARLCEQAGPDEVMCSIPASATANANAPTAQVEVRGIDHPVPVTTARLA